MKKIDGAPRTLKQLLDGTKYELDYYQREYRWGEKQVVELIQDLTSKFFEDYKEDHERKQVIDYGHYFLGSIIISEKQTRKYIVDGQQRLTTLTLLLIYLNNLQQDMEPKSMVESLIFSETYGEKSFNISVEERKECMEALFKGKSFEDSDQSESIKNIISRFETIRLHFPEEISNGSLLHFIDWMKENVHLVEITAYTDEDAYTIFETMNDRGLSLTPTEMLKGFLLSNIATGEDRTKANDTWKLVIDSLKEIGKDEDADCIKSWLRSQYAKTQRDKGKGAKAGDWDIIGTEFHRWVRDNKLTLKFKKPQNYFEFIIRDFKFFAKWYKIIRLASQEFQEGYEHVFYNARFGFTLQFQLLLAPLTIDDDDETCEKKIKIVAMYIDMMMARRIWGSRSSGYDTMKYIVFPLMKEIRHKSPEKLVKILTKKLDVHSEMFMSEANLTLNQKNRKRIHEILSRITSFLETGSGKESDYIKYISSRGKKRYDVEHIWADKYSRHKDEFDNEYEFSDFRNRIGDLLLLPSNFNESYGDMKYDKKLRNYDSQNLLARTLHSNCYKNNPGFLSFVKKSELPFENHPEFKKKDIEKRQELYLQMAKQIWNVNFLKEEIEY